MYKRFTDELKTETDLPVYEETLFEAKEFPCIVLEYMKPVIEYHGTREKHTHHFLFSIMDIVENYGNEKSPENHLKAKTFCYDKSMELYKKLKIKHRGIKFENIGFGSDYYKNKKVTLIAGILKVPE